MPSGLRIERPYGSVSAYLEGDAWIVERSEMLLINVHDLTTSDTVKFEIVLTSGASSRRPHPGFSIGASICGAMEALTRALAVELAPIRVNIVTPGFVDTGLWSNIPREALDKMFAEAAAKLPVGRIGTPDDIAEHYLAFMRGLYVTGQALVVDGGGVLV